VERFQRDHGLQVSGELTPGTISALGLDPNNMRESPYRSAYRGRW